MKIPTDVKNMTEKYLIDKGGICGQSCLAVIESSTIEQVLLNWKNLGMEFKGWSGWKQLREYLERRSYHIKQLRRDNINYEKSKFYILRIQWIGNGDKKDKPFYGWGHWSEASAHTHFIVVHNEKFFCNEEGIFDIEELNKYLDDKGVVTSAMEIDFLLRDNSP